MRIWVRFAPGVREGHVDGARWRGLALFGARAVGSFCEIWIERWLQGVPGWQLGSFFEIRVWDIGFCGPVWGFVARFGYRDDAKEPRSQGARKSRRSFSGASGVLAVNR